MQHDAFRSGNFDTRFVENYFKPASIPPATNEDEELIASLLATTLLNGNGKTVDETMAAPVSNWKKNRL
jgi:propionyl-CoA carboxylase alpha chain